jgi:hypothetical protein
VCSVETGKKEIGKEEVGLKICGIQDKGREGNNLPLLAQDSQPSNFSVQHSKGNQKEYMKKLGEKKKRGKGSRNLKGG